MGRPTTGDAERELVLDVVLEILDDEGSDAVRVRDVAERSRVSSKTIYKLFGTRDDLIIDAVARFMRLVVYANFSLPEADESIYDATVRAAKAMFTPFEQHPRMLEAFHQARSGPGGDRLNEAGRAAAYRVRDNLVRQEDAAYNRDYEEILENVFTGLVTRYVQGRIELQDIVPTIERVVARLALAHEPNRNFV